MANKDDMHDSLTRFLVLGCTSGAYHDFMTGLNAPSNLLDKIRAAGHLKEAFGYHQKQVTAAMIEEALEIKCSEAGSNRRRGEQLVISR
jgi:hypothetical protein